MENKLFTERIVAEHSLSLHGRTMVWLFILAGIHFAGTVILVEDTRLLFIVMALGVGVLWGGFGLWATITAKKGLPHPFISFVVIIVVAAAANILISEKPEQSLSRWSLWLLTIVVMAQFIISLNQKDFERILRYLPAVLSIFMVFAYIFQWDLKGTEEGVWHISSLFGGGICVAAFYLRGFWRWFFLAFGIVSLFFSASRGGLILTAATFVVFYMLHFRKSPETAIISLVVLVGVGSIAMPFISQVLYAFFEVKAKEGDVISSLLESYENRRTILERCWELFLAKPFGYGLGDAYHDHIRVREYDRNATLSAHNGLVSCVLETGFHVTMVMVAVVAYAIWKLFHFEFFNNNTKIVTQTFIIYYILRGLSEKYFVFNSGNMLTLMVNFIIIYVIFQYPRQASQEVHEFMEAQRRRRPGGRGPRRTRRRRRIRQPQLNLQ